MNNKDLTPNLTFVGKSFKPLVQTKKILKRDKLDATVTEEPISSVANDSELNTTEKELGYFKEGLLSNFTS